MLTLPMNDHPGANSSFALIPTFERCRPFGTICHLEPWLYLAITSCHALRIVRIEVRAMRTVAGADVDCAVERNSPI